MERGCAEVSGDAMVVLKVSGSLVRCLGASAWLQKLATPRDRDFMKVSAHPSLHMWRKSTTCGVALSVVAASLSRNNLGSVTEYIHRYA